MRPSETPSATLSIFEAANWWGEAPELLWRRYKDCNVKPALCAPGQGAAEPCPLCAITNGEEFHYRLRTAFSVGHWITVDRRLGSHSTLCIKGLHRPITLRTFPVPTGASPHQ